MKVDIKSLTKKFDKIIAVRQLTVSSKDGELVSILGPSGCGKSTLLYMLTGIVEPTEGDIYFDDKRINDIPIEKRNIGLVFQNYSLYPHMTVLENLIFPLSMMGMKKKQAIEEGMNISKILRIEDLLKRKPKELSGGQQQRVAIGRALIKKPKLLLMDEPFSNLDAALRVEMREEVKNLQKRFNITTFFVTHDQEEALSISDRILLMNGGEAVQYSTPNEIYNEPASMYAGAFIGNPKMNIIDKKEDIEKLMDKNVIFDENLKAIGIRPEDIFLFKDKNSLKGKIIDIYSLGKDTHFKVDVKGIVLRGLMTGNSNFNKDQNVKVDFNRIHYFKE